MKPRVFLIGTGVIARHHALASQQVFGDPAELFACDPSEEAREGFANEFPAAKIYAGSDEMLGSTAPQAEDIVCVATPPGHHLAETIKALASGRHALCEKPLVMDAAEARTMLAAARRAGRHIACCSSRFIGWELNRRVRELLATGAVGRPYLVDWQQREVCRRMGLEYQHGAWSFLDRRKNGGGALMDWGPYDFAVLLTVFRPRKVAVLHALCEQPQIHADLPPGTVFDVETQVVATIRFELADGSLLTIRYERTSASHGPACSVSGVYGSEGYLEWDWLPFGRQAAIRMCRTRPPDAGRTSEVMVEQPAPANEEWMFAPVREFHRFLQGAKDADVLIDDRAVHAALVLHAVYQSAQEQRSVEVSLD